MRDPNTTRVALTLIANFVKIVNFVAFRTDFDENLSQFLEHWMKLYLKGSCYTTFLRIILNF